MFSLRKSTTNFGGHSFFRRRCVAAPPLKGGSGAVRPAHLAEAGFDSCHSFAALFEHCDVSLTLHVPIASMSHCMRICRVRLLVVALLHNT